MPSFDEILAEVQATTERINELVAEGERSLSFPRRNAGPVLVSPDPSKPGRWRATRFDTDMVPTGHAEAPDFREALTAARYAGAIFTTPSRRLDTEAIP
jgi:hypothetical protein